jgi:hypothetical protein
VGKIHSLAGCFSLAIIYILNLFNSASQEKCRGEALASLSPVKNDYIYTPMLRPDATNEIKGRSIRG